MADNIKIPGLGEQSKKVVYAVAAGGVIIGGIAYYRAHHAAGSAASGSNIDPATGYVAGSAQDTAALAASDSIDPQTGFAYGSAADTGALASAPGNNNSGNSSGPPFASNDLWSQAAQAYLSSTVGIDSGQVSQALGAYLTGNQVTSDEQSIIQQAIAAEGLPPVASLNGYPPGIQPMPSPTTQPTQPGTGTGNGSGTGAGSTPTVPTNPATGKPYIQATDTSHYVITTTPQGVSYDIGVGSAAGSVHKLTDAELARDQAAGAKTVSAPPAVAPREGARTTATMTNDYTVVHDTTTGNYYDVTKAGTVHKLTPGELARDLAAGASVKHTNKTPVARK